MPLTNHRKQRAITKFIILVAIIIILTIVVISIGNKFEGPREVAEIINNFGPIAPIIAVALVALEVIVAPIPGFLIAIAVGYAFGLFGALYTYIGNMIGTAIAFLLAKNFGRPLVEVLFKKNKLEYYDCLVKENGRIFLWIAYIFPILPTDIISVLAGITDIRFKDFIIIPIIGYIPYVLLMNYLGVSLFEAGFGGYSAVVITIIFFSLLISYFVIMHFRKKHHYCQTKKNI